MGIRTIDGRQSAVASSSWLQSDYAPSTGEEEIVQEDPARASATTRKWEAKIAGDHLRRKLEGKPGQKGGHQTAKQSSAAHQPTTSTSEALAIDVVVPADRSDLSEYELLFHVVRAVLRERGGIEPSEAAVEEIVGLMRVQKWIVAGDVLRRAIRPAPVPVGRDLDGDGRADRIYQLQVNAQVQSEILRLRDFALEVTRRGIPAVNRMSIEERKAAVLQIYLERHDSSSTHKAIDAVLSLENLGLMTVGELLVAFGLAPEVAAVGFAKLAVSDLPELHQLCIQIKALTYGARKWTDLETAAEKLGELVVQAKTLAFNLVLGAAIGGVTRIGPKLTGEIVPTGKAVVTEGATTRWPLAAGTGSSPLRGAAGAGLRGIGEGATGATVTKPVSGEAVEKMRSPLEARLTPEERELIKPRAIEEQAYSETTKQVLREFRAKKVRTAQNIDQKPCKWVDIIDGFKSEAKEIEDLEEFASIIGQRVVYLGKALNMRGKRVDVAGIDGITADGRFVQVKNLGKTTGEKSVPENIVEAYEKAVKAPGKIEDELGARVTINHLEIFIIARQFSKRQVIEAWEKYLRGETKLDRAMIENRLLVWRATVLTSEGPIQLRPN